MVAAAVIIARLGRIALASVVFSLVACGVGSIGCASLPQSRAAFLEVQGKPYLTVSAHPSVCLVPCDVTLKAEIHGEIHWCPTLIRWQYGDGFHDAPIMSCQERIFSQVRHYGVGAWSPSAQIFSGEVPVADPLMSAVTVGVPATPQ